MNCPNCGKETPDSSKFCRSCGHAVGAVKQAESAAPSPETKEQKRRISIWAWIASGLMLVSLVLVALLILREPQMVEVEVTRIVEELVEVTRVVEVMPDAAETGVEAVKEVVVTRVVEVPVEVTRIVEAALPDAPDQNPIPTGDGEQLECTDEIGCVVIAPDEHIRLAAVLALSGPNEDLGVDSLRGIDLALDFREEILGHPLQILIVDSSCTAGGGQTAATEIVSDPQTVAMVGTSCSGAAVPAAKIISNAGYAMVSPSNTSPALTDPEAARQVGYYRTSHNDNIQGSTMAKFVIDELGVTKAAVIHDGDPYTESLATEFANHFAELDGEIIAFEAEVADATDVEPLLTAIAAAGPEMIYYPVFIPLGSLITNTAKTIPELEGVILAGSDGLQSPSFLKNTEGSSDGMYLSGLDLNFTGSFYQEEFLPAYIEKYGTEPIAPFHAHAFDATNMLLDAVEIVAQQDSDGSLLIGRQALRDALSATKGMEGITGTITCDRNGDCADPAITVNQVQNGAFIPIWFHSGRPNYLSLNSAGGKMH